MSNKKKDRDLEEIEFDETLTLPLLMQSLNVNKFSEKMITTRKQVEFIKTLIIDSHKDIIKDVKINKPIIHKIDKQNKSLVIALADTHFGEKTKNFNMDTADKMVDDLFDSALDAIDPSYDEITIVMLGDMVEGDGNIFSSQAYHMEETVMEQIRRCKNAIVRNAHKCSSLLKNGKVNIYGIPGNHGQKRGANVYDDTFSYDTCVYVGLFDIIETTKKYGKLNNVNVSFPLDSEESYTVDVKGWKFGLQHILPKNLLTPAGQMKIMSKLLNDKIDAVLTGHTHNATFTNIGKIKVMRVGCMPGPNSYSRNLNIPNDSPTQLYFTTTKDCLAKDINIHDLSKLLIKRA